MTKIFVLYSLVLLSIACAQNGLEQTIGAAIDDVDILKINVGGPALPPIGFIADEPSFYSRSTGNPQAFEDTSAPVVPLDWGEVYRTHRYAEGGTLSYTLPVPDGLFTIGLLFVEQFEGAAREGGRVLDVYINGKLLEPGVDVWSLAGGKIYEPYYLEMQDISSTEGSITIGLVPIKENPMLSGIILEGVGAGSLVMKTSPSTTPSVLSAVIPSVQVTSTTVESTVGDNTSPENDLLPTPIMTTSSIVDEGGTGNDSAFVQTNYELSTWSNVEYSDGNPVARHEACSVFAEGLVYLIGGRGMKPISTYDPLTASWAVKTGPPEEVNHMQCVYYRGRIYVGGSWYGKYPFEKEHAVTWAYDIKTDGWLTLTGLPEERRRGGGAFVSYEDRLYLSHGTKGGHGIHANATGLLDMYNPATDRWSALPAGPLPRDHTAGAIVNGKLCVAGGRDGGQQDFWNANVGPVVCYTFATQSWETKASLPVPRGGAMVGTTCEGLVMIAGGEGKTPDNQVGQAFDRVDFYEESSDLFLQPTFMTSRRHGSGLAITSCECSSIFVPSGSAGLGAGPEVSTTDVWSTEQNGGSCM